MQTSEEALQDHWTSPYVGKVYADGATEVLSVGMEFLVDGQAAQRACVRDLEHLLFVLGAL